MNTDMNPINFWHQHIGQHIGSIEAGDTKPRVPTRLKRGIDPNTLGAGIDAFYIACEGMSHVVGKVELPNSKHITYTASENISGEKFIAQWLAHDAPTDQPWIVGVIGKANPNASFVLSQPPSLCSFCQSSKGFEFNLHHFRADVELIKGLDWKLVTQAMYALNDFTSLNEYQITKGRNSLTKLFKNEPRLKQVLPHLRAKPNNGEHQILSWYNRTR